MRFTRLRKNIESSTSISTAPDFPKNDPAEASFSGDPKINVKKRKREMKTEDGHPELGVEKTQNRPGVKTESVQTGFLRATEFLKRQTLDKRVDMSGELESDPSPTPGPRMRHGDDTSAHQKGHDAVDEDENTSLDSLDSE